jgi:hypothetical protein
MINGSNLSYRNRAAHKMGDIPPLAAMDKDPLTQSLRFFAHISDFLGGLNGLQVVIVNPTVAPGLIVILSVVNNNVKCHRITFQEQIILDLGEKANMKWLREYRRLKKAEYIP